MHPYSEFIHDYIIKTNGYSGKGKIKDDFRTSRWGKIMRKYWIDEIPQLYNVLRGEMKLVGVRPVSQIYFDTIPAELKEIRLQMKPGCIPPYVALDLGVRKEDVLNAEAQYLRDKIRRPYINDLIYFFKAIYKIIFRGRRSA
jgi:lipopolysaccharide/colanic/teichoic acid biosynthesis glycosyltransferase